MYQTVKRFIRRDDRSLTYSKIKQILFELQQVIKQYTKESYVNKIKLFEYLYPILNKAHTGLNILKDTYDNDKTFQSKMEVEIHIVEMTIDNLKRELEYCMKNNPELLDKETISLFSNNEIRVSSPILITQKTSNSQQNNTPLMNSISPTEILHQAHIAQFQTSLQPVQTSLQPVPQPLSPRQLNKELDDNWD